MNGDGQQNGSTASGERPSDSISRLSTSEFRRPAAEIADMAEGLSLIASKIERGFKLLVTFHPPNGKAQKFLLHVDNRQQGELLEILGEIRELDDLLPEEGLSLEIVDLVLENWYQRVLQRTS